MKRFQWIDEAKGLGILFVMLGHCYLEDKFVFWFTSFCMALFFFLSGYVFHRKASYQEFLMKKIRTLLIPYLCFAGITMLHNGILAVSHGSEYSVIEILLQYLLQIRYTPLWFLPCIFLAEQVLYFMTGLAEGRNRSFWLMGSAIGFTAFFLYRRFIDMNLLWNADLSILAVSFMCFGKWMSLYFGQKREEGADLWVSAVLGVCYLVGVVVQFQVFGQVDWYSNRYGNPLLFAIVATLGAVIVMELSRKISVPCLAALGRNSILFYALHRLVIDDSFVLYNKLGIDIVDGSMQSLLFGGLSVAIALCVLMPVNWFVVRFMPVCVGKTYHRGLK